MKWIIKVKDDKDKRIVINYNPLDDNIVFNGQSRINGNWVNFTNNFITTNNINLNKIQTLLVKSHNELINRYDTYENLNTGLNVISEVDFTEDNE